MKGHLSKSKIRIFIIIIPVFFYFSCNAYAQSIPDSVNREISKLESDSAIINALNKYCLSYTFSKPFVALSLAKKAAELSLKSHNYRKLPEISLEIANIYFLTSNYDKAFDYAMNTLYIYIKLGSKKGIAQASNSVGIIYLKKGNIVQALRYFTLALKINENLKDKEAIAANLGNISLVYKYNKNYTKAIEYSLKALDIMRELNYKRGIAGSLNNIGNFFMELRKIPEALKCFLESLEIVEEIGDKYGQATTLSNIGGLYKLDKKYPQAIYYLNKSLQISSELNDKQNTGMIYTNFAIIYTETKDFAKAKDYLIKSLAINKKLDTKGKLYLNYLDLSEVCSKLGDYKEAYKYHVMYSNLKDSLFNKDKNAQLLEIQAKYETEKKETQILLLQKDKDVQTLQIKRSRNMIAFITAGAILILMFAIYIFLNMRRKQMTNKVLYLQNKIIERQKAEIAEEKMKSDNVLLHILPPDVVHDIKADGKVTLEHYELLAKLFTDLQREKMLSQFEALKNQVNPHFLFNSLSLLSSLVHEDPELSEQFIDKLAKAYRYVLEHKDKELVSLDTETEFIHSYAFLMKMRFGDKFSLNIKLENTQDFYIPPLTLQIIIENAVKHNVISKEIPLNIDVFSENDTYIVIRNNFNPREQEQKTTGIGLRNIRKRYGFFTDVPVESGIYDNFFIVKIPLLGLKTDNTILKNDAFG